jgi:hypothetical protein
MDVRSLFDKAYLYAYDLQGRDVTVTIVKVVGGTLQCTDGSKKKVPVLFFQGAKKGFGTNITNARTIAAMYGTFDSDKWIGKRITLYPTTTNVGGATKDCIRIRPTIPKGNVEDAPPVEPTPEREPGADDDESAAS